MKIIMKVFVIILIIFSIMCSSIVYAADNVNINMNITGNTKLQTNQKSLTLTISLGEFENIQSGKVLGFEGILNCSEGVFKNITAKGLNGWNIEYKDSTKKIIGDVAEAKPNTTIGTVTFELNNNVNGTNPKIEFKDILLTDGTNDFTINKTFNITWENSNEEQQSTNEDSETKPQQQVQTQKPQEAQQTEKVDSTDKNQGENVVKSEESVNKNQEPSVKKDNQTITATTEKSLSSSSNNKEKTTTLSSNSAKKTKNSSSSTAKKLPKTGFRNGLLISLSVIIIFAIILKIKLKKSKF